MEQILVIPAAQSPLADVARNCGDRTLARTWYVAVCHDTSPCDASSPPTAAFEMLASKDTDGRFAWHLRPFSDLADDPLNPPISHPSPDPEACADDPTQPPLEARQVVVHFECSTAEPLVRGAGAGMSVRPVVRDLPDDAATGAPVAATIDLLAVGPTLVEHVFGYGEWLPSAGVDGIALAENGTLTVDFAAGLELHPSGVYAGTIDPLLATVAQFDQVEVLRVTIEGSCETTGLAAETGTCEWPITADLAAAVPRL